MTAEQPAPKPGRADVYPVARAALNDMLDGRYLKGVETYGTPLQTHNGRDPYQDAMEEAVDLWQYLIQARMEYADALHCIAGLEAEVDELLFLSGQPLKYGGEVG